MDAPLLNGREPGRDPAPFRLRYPIHALTEDPRRPLKMRVRPQTIWEREKVPIIVLCAERNEFAEESAQEEPTVWQAIATSTNRSSDDWWLET